VNQAAVLPGGGSVGPNAVTRIAEALAGEHRPGLVDAVFRDARLRDHLAVPPTRMVPEEDVARLYAALFLELGPDRARRVAREAGRLTGDYLLANRIPAFARHALRLLPRAMAARLLVSAIARHAWTFAGSGSFAWHSPSAPGAPQMELVVQGSPLCRHVREPEPSCDYYAGTFERVFRAIVDPAATVIETECMAAGASACRFAVRWTGQG
jgi:divinyl protochlorophyllide a 8-vinyl-reductase